MSAKWLESLWRNPLIASVKEPKQLEKVVDNHIEVVFLLTGNIGVIKAYVDYYKKHDRHVFLHLEKIGGLSLDRAGLEYVANYVKPTGIVSTKNTMIKQAKKLGLLTVQRLFLIDTDALVHGISALQENCPDAVELMPARIPELISTVKSEIDVPIITGGLIETRAQMDAALQGGASGVSTSRTALWGERLEGTKRDQ